MKNSQIRIISGKFKGRKLATPTRETTHTMGSRERTALFNMILPYLGNAVVLDTFAGSGALGLEALSRGAKTATFVEISASATSVIRQNIASLGVEQQTTILQRPVEKFHSTQKFDVVFVDPPYTNYRHQTIWTIIKQILPVIGDNGILVLSHPAGHTPVFEGFELLTSRQYAAANLTIFQKK